MTAEIIALRKEQTDKHISNPCRTCRHCKPDNSWWLFAIIPFLIPAINRNRWRYAKCSNKKIPWIATKIEEERRAILSITGKAETRDESDEWSFCSVLRESSELLCGGRYWEPKP